MKKFLVIEILFNIHKYIGFSISIKLITDSIWTFFPKHISLWKNFLKELLKKKNSSLKEAPSCVWNEWKRKKILFRNKLNFCNFIYFLILRNLLFDLKRPRIVRVRLQIVNIFKLLETYKKIHLNLEIKRYTLLLRIISLWSHFGIPFSRKVFLTLSVH